MVNKKRSKKNISRNCTDVFVPRSILSLRSNPFERVLPRSAQQLFITFLIDESTVQFLTFYFFSFMFIGASATRLFIITRERRHYGNVLGFTQFLRKIIIYEQPRTYLTIGRHAELVSTKTFTRLW